MLECLICLNTYFNHEEFEKHLESSGHGRTRSELKEIGAPPPSLLSQRPRQKREYAQTCRQCSQSFATNKKLRLHLNQAGHHLSGKRPQKEPENAKKLSINRSADVTETGNDEVYIIENHHQLQLDQVDVREVSSSLRLHLDCANIPLVQTQIDVMDPRKLPKRFPTITVPSRPNEKPCTVVECSSGKPILWKLIPIDFSSEAVPASSNGEFDASTIDLLAEELKKNTSASFLPASECLKTGVSSTISPIQLHSPRSLSPLIEDVNTSGPSNKTSKLNLDLTLKNICIAIPDEIVTESAEPSTSPLSKNTANLLEIHQMDFLAEQLKKNTSASFIPTSECLKTGVSSITSPDQLHSSRSSTPLIDELTTNERSNQTSKLDPDLTLKSSCIANPDEIVTETTEPSTLPLSKQLIQTDETSSKNSNEHTLPTYESNLTVVPEISDASLNSSIQTLKLSTPPIRPEELNPTCKDSVTVSGGVDYCPRCNAVINITDVTFCLRTGRVSLKCRNCSIHINMEDAYKPQ